MDRIVEGAGVLEPGPHAGTTADGRSSYWRILRPYFALLRGCAAGLLAVALATFCAFRLHLNLSTSGSLYFLIVVMVSSFWGFWEASLTSLLAVNCLNYFFVEPHLTWRVADPQNWVALATFEITALTVSRLSARVQGQARAEARQRRQLEKLYELGRRILLVDRRQAIGPQIVLVLREVLQAESVALFDARLARMDTSGQPSAELEELARGAYFQDRALESPDPATWAHVLRLGLKPIGAVALRSQGFDPLAAGPIASLAAIAIERARSFEEECRADAARQTEQLRAAVLDALAHAVKTPLTAIRTASSGLLESGRLAGDDLELAALIEEQTDRLNRLTSELLQMARIDGTEVKLCSTRFSVLSLIEDVLERQRTQLQGRHIDVDERASDVEVFGDREILATALEQFVDNACRYSTPGSPITIRGAESLGEIVIAIHNEGPAIPRAEWDRIFDRFYRTEDARHRASGTGLGLSIAKKAAQAHAGRTWVASEEQAGTTFFLAIPRGIRRKVESVTRQAADR